MKKDKEENKEREKSKEERERGEERRKAEEREKELVGIPVQVKRPLLIASFIFSILVIGSIGTYAMLSPTKLFIGDSVSFESNETRFDRILATGENILIETPLSSGFSALAGSLTSNAVLAKNVNIVAGNIHIAEPIHGNAFLAGGNVLIDAPVKGNVRVIAGKLFISSNTVIGGDLSMRGGSVEIRGDVSGDASLQAKDALLDGHVEGNLELESNSLEVKNRFRVGGDLIYSLPESVDVSSLDVEGKIREQKSADTIFQSRIVRTLFSFISYFIISCLVFVLFPSTQLLFEKRLITKPGNTLLLSLPIFLGITALIVITLLSVLFTAVGIMLAGTFILFLYLAKIPIAWWLGDRVIAILSDKKPERPLIPARRLLIGLVILYLVGLIPIVGRIIGFIVLLIGFSVWIITRYDTHLLVMATYKYLKKEIAKK